MLGAHLPLTCLPRSDPAALRRAAVWLRHVKGLLVLAMALPTLAGSPAPFTQEAALRGINYYTPFGVGAGRGVACADLDGDGDADIVTVGREDGVVGVFENDGTGHFTDRSAGSGIPALLKYTGVVAGDYDGDGDLDLYLGRWLAPNVLVRNDGGLTFSDVTLAAGVGDTGAAAGCAWGDYDNDGWLDLYVANMAGTVSPIPNRLYHNLGNGTFAEVAAMLGVADPNLTWQAVLFDYDADGDADLYLSNDKATPPCTYHNYLFANVGGAFVDVTEQSGTGACIFSMGVAIGDFDGNGHQDIYCTNFPPGNPLYLNKGNGTFLEYSVPAGVASYAIGWGTVFFDFDNDGRLDLYVCNQYASNRLYHYTGSWPCLDLAPELGVADPEDSYGVAVADVDNDGDLDLLVQNDNQPIRLYINHEGQQRRWLKVRLQGQAPNRYAVGAHVRVRTGAIWRMREVLAGSNFKSQNDLTQHFGLDQATQVDEVQVHWPGSGTTTVTNVPSNTTLLICQNNAAPPAASVPSPPHAAVDVPAATALSWSGAAGATFKVYFGTTANPPLAATTSATSWSPPGTPGLAALTTYYWRIDSSSAGCATSAGPTWSFTTVGIVPTSALAVSITDPTSEPEFTTSSTTVSLAGTVAGDDQILAVTWSDEHGGSGPCQGTTAWSVSNIPLVAGANTITVTAADLNGASATDQIVVTYIPEAATPTVPPVIEIIMPTRESQWETDRDALSIAGTASDGVVTVSWSNDRGGNGPCEGTSTWSASNVPLMHGENIITVTAHDAADPPRQASAALTVNYRESVPPVISITVPTSEPRFTLMRESLLAPPPLLRLEGTADDNVAVTQVTWTLVPETLVPESVLAPPSASGIAEGTIEWVIDGLALTEGENQITVTASDAAGNTASDSLVVVLTDPDAPAADSPAQPPGDAPASTATGDSAADDDPPSGPADPPSEDATRTIRSHPRSACGLGVISAIGTLSLARCVRHRPGRCTRPRRGGFRSRR